MFTNNEVGSPRTASSDGGSNSPLDQNELKQRVFTLRHIESGEYICLRQNGMEHLACFSDGDSALQFRLDLGLLEHVDISAARLCDTPFDKFWLNGEMTGRAVAAVHAAAAH